MQLRLEIAVLPGGGHQVSGGQNIVSQGIRKSTLVDTEMLTAVSSPTAASNPSLIVLAFWQPDWVAGAAGNGTSSLLRPSIRRKQQRKLVEIFIFIIDESLPRQPSPHVWEKFTQALNLSCPVASAYKSVPLLRWRNTSDSRNSRPDHPGAHYARPDHPGACYPRPRAR